MLILLVCACFHAAVQTHANIMQQEVGSQSLARVARSPIALFQFTHLTDGLRSYLQLSLMKQESALEAELNQAKSGKQRSTES